MGRRRRAQPRDVALEAQAAAYLSSQGNDQARIAELLGISQGEVSRLLRQARREGWLQVRCELPPGAMERIEQVVFPGRDQVRARLDHEADAHEAPRVRGVRVVAGAAEAADYDERLRGFGRAAAARLQELFPAMRLAGVAWGRTIAHVVEGLRQLHPQPPRLPAPVQFVPLTGEPLAYPDPETSSSTLAHRLNEVVSGGAAPFVSLAAVPAFIPARFSRPGREVIRDFIGEIAGYRAVFTRQNEQGRPQAPLVDRLDTILTAVGTVSTTVSGRLLDDRMEAEGITKEQLGRRVIGDIGGVFLPRESRDPVVRGINERWTGVRLEHLARCAWAAREAAQEAAGERPPPGVVVLAAGAVKAPVVLACVRAGLASELILDHELARALIEGPA